MRTLTSLSRWGFRLSMVVGLAAIFLLTQPGTVAAHPLGNFSVNRYSGLLVAPSTVTLHYVVDMAEIPVFQLMPVIDRDADGEVTAGEAAAYAAGQASSLARNLRLTADGRPLPWESGPVAATITPGQADLPTVRFEWRFTARRPNEARSLHVIFEDGNFVDRLGWREVVVTPVDGAGLQNASVPASGISDALRNYPEARLAAPPNVTGATFTWLTAYAPSGGNAAAPMPDGRPVTDLASGDARLTEMLTYESLGPGALAAAFLLAIVLGALHAMSPGHGKTIVGAYLVGSRGTPRHAIFLGLTTTITHTAGVFAFGLLVLFASRYILPERLYPWLTLLSGLLVFLIGASLVTSLWRRRQPDVIGEEGFHYHLGFGHAHAPATDDRGVSWRNLLALGVSGGLLPCPSALLLLLAAIALGRVTLGLLLIGAFSIGLAAVLTAVGLLLVYAGRLVERTPWRNARLARLAPIFSASFVTLAGAAMTLQALREVGLL